MRSRHPFPDVEEQPPTAEVAVPFEPTAMPALSAHATADPVTQETPVRWHTVENRQQRRRGVATFQGPKELGPKLRRELLEKRQRAAHGKLDVELRRLQRKALKNGRTL